MFYMLILYFDLVKYKFDENQVKAQRVPFLGTAPPLLSFHCTWDLTYCNSAEIMISYEILDAVLARFLERQGLLRKNTTLAYRVYVVVSTTLHGSDLDLASHC